MHIGIDGRSLIGELTGIGRYTFELSKKLILNSEENPREWWNGLYILVIKK